MIQQTSILKCDLCFPDAVEYGVICEDYSLIYNEGKFHILEGAGHSCDILFTFPIDPWADPDPDCREDASDETIEAANQWLHDMDEVRKAFVLPIDSGWRFIDSIKKIKNTKGCSVSFIFDLCGRMRENKLPNRSEVNKTHWKFGIIKKNIVLDSKVIGTADCPMEKIFGIHEIYYDENNKISWTIEPTLVSESISGLKRTLEEMMKVIDEPIFVEENGKLVQK